MVKPSLNNLAKHLSAVFGALIWIVVSSTANAEILLAYNQANYVNKKPGQNKFNIVVIGDSLGDGIWAGLVRDFRTQRRQFDVVKKSRVSTGLVRQDYYDWNKALATILATERVDIAVVLFGTNDQQPIRGNRGLLRVGTSDWRTAYSERVDRIIQQLRDKNVAIYWLGLPIMRSKSFSKHAETINEIIRERSRAAGVKFLDVWPAFVDARGRYSAYGRDQRGRRIKLRANDGIHFTMSGYVRFASVAAEEIRRDIARTRGHGASSKPATPRYRNGRRLVVPPLPRLRPSRDTNNDVAPNVTVRDRAPSATPPVASTVATRSAATVVNLEPVTPIAEVRAPVMPLPVMRPDYRYTRSFGIRHR